MESFTGETVEQLGDAIREGMRAFTEGAAQSDDITILVVQHKGPSS
jgi:serine phosphatase RsbU (regulator of sigma subunit)